MKKYTEKWLYLQMFLWSRHVEIVEPSKKLKEMQKIISSLR